MVDGIFDPTIGALNTSLNLRLVNQNVISSNIANADTPGYKAQRVEFEQALREALNISNHLELKGTHPGHIGHKPTEPVNPEIYEDANGVESLDGNTVDRAKEMSMLVENQLIYDSTVEMMKKKLGMLKYAINEGGGGR